MAGGLRADHPSRGGHGTGADAKPIPTTTPSNTRIATSPSSAPVPPGSPPPCAASRAGARVMLFDEQAEFGGSLLAETRASIDGARARRLARRDACRTRRLASRDDAAAHANLRLLRAEFPRRSAAPDRSSRRSRPQDSARAAVAGARQAGRAGDRRARAAAGVPRQRSSGHHARRGGARSGDALRRQAGDAHRRRHRARFGLSRRAGPRRSRLRNRGDRRSARRGRGSAARGRAPRRPARRGERRDPRLLRRPARHARARRQALGRRDAGQGRADRLRPDRDERRLDAERQPSFAIARQARLRRGDAEFSARRRRRGSALGGRLPRRFRSCGRRSPTAPTRAPRRRARRRRRRRASRARLRPRAARSGSSPATSEKARAKAFVDFQNDVTARDIQLATREGMRSIEHIKRYTTAGMATDQGKTSNLNALAIAAEALGRRIAEVGLTTFRPPYTPVTFATFAGLARRDLFDPIRETPLHAWSARQGAKFEEVGLWKRASYFAGRGESMDEAVRRECLATRASAGIMDASTLGKIEVVGPDAAEFLDRLYVNSFAKLEVGRCRYALMLSEDGFIADDGVVMRLAADRFHVTTTSSGAARVFAVMEDYLADGMERSEGLVHVDHRAVRHYSDQRPRRAQDARAAGRRHRSFRRRVPAHERARGPDLRRADAAGAGQLHRRTRLRGQRSRRLRRERASRRSGRRGKSSAPRSTAWRRCTSCAPKRASSSSARTPTERRRPTTSAWAGWSPSPSPTSSASAR